MNARDEQSQQITLRDQRKLAFSEYGVPDGKPIFYFNGTPGSRLEFVGHEDIARKHGARVIATDRPGFGLSDLQPGRRLTDWPDDIIQLADYLQIDQFGIIGVSAGGMHAQICAVKVPERLTNVALVGSPIPLDRPEAFEGMSTLNRSIFWLGHNLPWLYWIYINLLVLAIGKDTDRLVKVVSQAAHTTDKELFFSPLHYERYKANFGEAVRNGTKGVVQELYLSARPWGIEPEDIGIKVNIWHGGLDTNTPPSMGRLLAQRIPDNKLWFYEDLAHYTLLHERLDEIVRETVR